MDYDYSRLIVDGVVGQAMDGLRLANAYFPHKDGVRVGSRRTLMDVFNDEALLEKAIFKRVKHGAFASEGKSAYRLSFSEIRKGLLGFSGTQGVSNFRPTAAAAIYHKFLPEKDGVTWDMSMGWGGRLLGAVACDKVHKYLAAIPRRRLSRACLR